MDRKQLVDALGTVRPALATASLVESLTHLLFTGKEVVAYNDQVGISAPLAVSFSGAVPGATLLSMLAASKAKEVELAATGEEVIVKAGGAKLRLPLRPPESFLFEMPKPPKDADALSAAGESFVASLRGCLRSVSPDTSVPEQLGVTVIPKKSSVEMYSVNGSTMSRASAKLSKPTSLKRRLVLSAPFCEQVVKLAAGDEGAEVLLTDEYSLLRASSGARALGRLVEVHKPLDFEKLFAEIVPAGLAEEAITVPPPLRLALERAMVISDPSGERVYSRVQVKDEVMHIATKSARGELTDRVRVAGHPDVSVSVDAQWFKAGVAEGFSKFLVTKGSIIMARGSELYLVATLN